MLNKQRREKPIRNNKGSAKGGVDVLRFRCG
jgi:hypothetical protein